MCKKGKVVFSDIEKQGKVSVSWVINRETRSEAPYRYIIYAAKPSELVQLPNALQKILSFLFLPLFPARKSEKGI